MILIKAGKIIDWKNKTFKERIARIKKNTRRNPI